MNSNERLALLRGYASFILGAAGILAQLGFYLASDGKILSTFFFGLCVALVSEPEKLIKAVISQIRGGAGGGGSSDPPSKT